MSITELLVTASNRSKRGDIRGALSMVQTWQENNPDLEDPNVDGLRFMLTRALGDKEQAIEIANQRLNHEQSKLSKSTWLLRRGLLYIEKEDGQNALADMNEVLRLGTNEHHLRQARVGLLRIADRVWRTP